MTDEATGHRRGRRPKGATSGREALLRAANACFLRAGYAASLRDIAAEAGVDMALVARLFGSKEKLWEAVVEWHEAALARHLKAVDELESLPAGEALRRLFALHAAQCVAYPFIALFMHEAVNPGPRLSNIVERLVVPLRLRYLPFLERAVEGGAARAADPELALTMLLTGIGVPLVAPVLCGENLARRLVDETCVLLGLPPERDTPAPG